MLNIGVRGSDDTGGQLRTCGRLDAATVGFASVAATLPTQCRDWSDAKVPCTSYGWYAEVASAAGVVVISLTSRPTRSILTAVNSSVPAILRDVRRYTIIFCIGRQVGIRRLDRHHAQRSPATPPMVPAEIISTHGRQRMSRLASSRHCAHQMPGCRVMVAVKPSGASAVAVLIARPG